ncbi:CusA/CzcA family heavy metal efflux RND transporter [Robertkochia sediminum]|uniref:CusA/CzcA family heavy metal efflux RND transporter n=1 Tax=Robertkochia sediminum TaxID=2785326 RepID=UPI0019324C3B|nr:CusA/CzcA family heavy metal efflux RND transporter [Robertkochia sediminum]MBL7474082.1 CusA/CzcA family heavy metal efflux RND transporter [Robertkochia sediminum]
MLTRLIHFSVNNKLIIFLSTFFLIGFGLYSLSRLSIGAVPDITNNQVQVITTSRNLSTQDMEKFITYPVELEMANLPGVTEIRSVSKFGLSVVTIVFDDDMGTYFPRQLITEKIKSASERIPEGFGTPELGPITTGLGEIYQYVLDVKPKYKDRYTAMDLRTIQDWIVKRKLSGIPGVVEINTWGGYLKQYEVAINTSSLNALNLSVGEVFEALENNNNVSGGGYIEKTDQSYFIRGEGLVTSLDDLRKIIVTTRNGSPVAIGDIAQVGYGYATRFGAITGNGEGEKVLGQVMMLKDANSKQVIDAVKQRVDEISKSLPEGVYINAFLDRSELINKTTFTVTENLILGFLIVIFAVMLILGNLRSGLVIASVIPLSLLFALSLMYIFGVDANLMSLGAIDFGIIIDGAVIIVEFIAFKLAGEKLGTDRLKKKEQQELRDRVSIQGASEMMNSAVFGQLIILIVFIPILSLSGIEGKMFKPMALTFCFALIGAMILCFTYVPVMSALFLRETRKKNNLSAKVMGIIESMYTPFLYMAMRNKKTVLVLASLLVLLGGIIFSRLGGEFVPTLDEGDFVIQPVLKTGTSLSKTIETTTRIENILLDNFPEVKQVVSRIGAAEVPTDPMSMEDSDVIITLKDKDEWVSAHTKDDLAEKFKEALAVIPGIEIEFTQPIEMRFNELISGVRSDIAVKVFGEDLETLARLGDRIKTLAESVPGAADVTVEKIEGLPQMNVSYNRTKIARYGLHIHELNDLIAMGFSGKTAGSIFEGEKQFDLVVRLQEEHRKGIEDLRSLFVDLPNGQQVPLGELATITYKKGAAKISRDNTQRRIVVGINVRNRDLQSVVDDIRGLIEKEIDLPVGYTVAYGGQFENLREAKSRLLVAVPIALVLIFFMLFFAFNSLKKAVLIYSAIPLSAVGGVLLLALRGMPFSISAGVGFIALFGIAVLNGIVLIEHFKDMNMSKFKSVEALVIQGTKDRLRAVILTATAAALGFLPMAVSTNVGAEVQRPLATVVIGGLITATLLTLVVLPVLYTMIYEKKDTKTNTSRPETPVAGIVFLIGASLWGTVATAQVPVLDLDSLESAALENNTGLKALSFEKLREESLKGAAWDFDKTSIYYQYDQNNLAINGRPIEVIGIQQDFRFPTVYTSMRNVQKVRAERSVYHYDLSSRRLLRDLQTAYYQYQITLEKQHIYAKLDSLYKKFANAASRRFELGETNYLEKITARSKQQQVTIHLQETQTEVNILKNRITLLVQAKDSFAINREPPEKLPYFPPDTLLSPELNIMDSEVRLREAENTLEKHKLLPDISLEYFRGSNSTLNEQLYGYQVGLKIPILFGGQASKIKASGLAEAAMTNERQDFLLNYKNKKQELESLLQTYDNNLAYYENEGKAIAGELIHTAEAGFINGELDFFQYIQTLENAYRILIDRLDQLRLYNDTVIQLRHLTLSE